MSTSDSQTKRRELNTDDFPSVESDHVELELTKHHLRGEGATLTVTEDGREWTMQVDEQFRISTDEELPAWLETVLDKLGFWLA